MTTTTSTYVSEMDDALKLNIIRDYEQLERDGHIGDCVLRSETEKMMKLMGARDSYITVFMSATANECYRYFAMKYIVANKL